MATPSEHHHDTAGKNGVAMVDIDLLQAREARGKHPLQETPLLAEPRNSHGSSANLLHRRPSTVDVVSKGWRRILTRKPIRVVHAEEANEKLERTLGLWDLIAIGVGGTVGSGVFVLCGLIIHEYAGSATVLSWTVAGIGCLLSGMAYAELCILIPSGGSAYAYTYVALGELPAFIVGCCLTLENGFSASAVARSWGDKVSTYVQSINGLDADPDAEGYSSGNQLLQFGDSSLYSALLQVLCVVIVLCGINASKLTVNVFCVAKVLLVIFMILMSFSLYKGQYFTPFMPYGAPGVMHGSISAFFGYLGFDAVCMLSMEAKDPHRNVPLSLFATIAIVSVIYGLAAVSLAGVLPYQQIDSGSGFAEAFRDRGVWWAHQVAAVGEICTLPLVVLVSFIGQPRLQCAMSEDGLLPKAFAEVNANGTLWKGTLAAGIIAVAVAAIVPFRYLDDMISAGVLLALVFTNSSLIVLRLQGTPEMSHEGASRAGVTIRLGPGVEGVHLSCAALVVLSNLLLFGSAALWSRSDGALVTAAALVVTALAVLLVGCIQRWCPPAPDPLKDYNQDGMHFRVPWVPWLPSLATWLNWYLVVQLTWAGGLTLMSYLGAGSLYYMLYGFRHSVGSNTGWGELLSRFGPTSRRTSEAPDDLSDTFDLDNGDLVADIQSPPWLKQQHSYSTTNGDLQPDVA